jgi:hypothetical protein
LFNQRALAGETLSQASREDWLRTYSRLMTIMAARSDAPILAMDNLPSVSMNEKSARRWPFVDIESEYLVDIDFSTIISSILLEQTQGKLSALSCNTALYYLKSASRNVDSLMKKKRRQAKDVRLPAASQEMTSRAAITEFNLKRILEIMSNWAGSYCDWKRGVD